MNIPPSTLRELIEYKPDSGVFRWKSRPVKFFKAGKRQKNSWSLWNSQHAGKLCLCTPTNGYLCGRVLGKTLKSHRVAWAITHGKWPQYEIDHINRRKDDNRLANLREASRTLNCLNRGIMPTNKTGVVGVHRHKGGGFVAKYRNRYLGWYPTIDEAEAARRAAMMDDEDILTDWMNP